MVPQVLHDGASAHERARPAYPRAARGGLQPWSAPSNPGTVHGFGAGARLLVRDHRRRKARGGQAVADLGAHQRRVRDRVVRARGTGRRLCACVCM